MDWIRKAYDLLHRLTDPQQLSQMATQMGPGLDVLLFVIVFCETGLVVTPFLPGDSLLFAVGALGSLPGSPVNLWSLSALLVVAAVLGDAVNYAVGKRLGPAVFHGEGRRWLNRKHLATAHEFYERHGGKTIILARFVPIVRTFAPFVAGVGCMGYRRFAIYNVVGAVLWVGLMVSAGRLFGGIPWVQRNFETVIVGIVVVSVLPGVVEYLRARRRKA